MWQVLPALEKEVREWEQKFRVMDAIKNAKDKLKRLKQEMAWSYVNMTRSVGVLLLFLPSG